LTARNQQQQLHTAEVGIASGLAEVESGQLYCPRSQAFASSGRGAVIQLDGTRSATAAPQGSGRNSEGIERSEDSRDNKESKDNKDSKDSKDSASKNKSRSCRSRSWCRHPRSCRSCGKDIEGDKGSKDIDGGGRLRRLRRLGGNNGGKGYRRLGVECGKRQQQPTA
jgi:hypothetical protein